MGTNFYWIDEQRPNLPDDYSGDKDHIGKRSAAGLYCFDCGIPLVENGSHLINLGQAAYHSNAVKRLKACPKCNGIPQEESLAYSAAGAELFGYPQPQYRKHGVKTCSTFIWAQEPDLILSICRQHKTEEVIEDEYSAKITGQEFINMLYTNCPIQFFDSIGQKNWS